MNNGIPWIITRRRKIISFLIDFSITTFFYNFFYVEEFETYPNKIVPLSITFFWVTISYILGRYSGSKFFNYESFAKSLLKIIFLFILCNIIYLFINLSIPLLFQSGDLFYEHFSIELSNFFIRIIFYISITSLFFQYVFISLTQKIIDRKEYWIFIGSNEKFRNLVKEIKLQEKNINVIQNNNFEPSQKAILRSLNGIIIEDLNSLDKSKLKNILKLEGIKVETLLIWFEREFHRIPSELIINKYELLLGFKSLDYKYQLRVKRVGDILASLILILITAPITLLISLLIIIEDKGPIFYSQIRTGINGERIKIFKFRSMRIDAEKEGIQWSNSMDKRITKIGKIIRAIRIDELPQLLCVINGSMSLIGPRPERPEIEQKLLLEIPFYNHRYIFKPGLSGWAQVNYPYGASVSDTEKKLSFDLYYISHFSLFLDLLILLKTIKLVIRAKGSKPNK